EREYFHTRAQTRTPLLATRPPPRLPSRAARHGLSRAPVAVPRGTLFSEAESYGKIRRGVRSLKARWDWALAEACPSVRDLPWRPSRIAQMLVHGFSRRTFLRIIFGLHDPLIPARLV